jgi:predicted RNase H-like HicB family nuclease
MSYGPYTVRVWRESDGGWSAAASEVDGAFTAGDSLVEVERHARESIAAMLDLPRSAEADMTVILEVSVDHGGPADQMIAAAHAARQAAAHAAQATAAAVSELRQRGISVRDVSRLVGVTAGRVSQLDKNAA